MQGLREKANAEMVLASEIDILEILKRAKNYQSGEGVSAFESEANVREEVNRRTCKAGYTTRNGEPIGTEKIMSRGIGEPKKLNIWLRDENGQLIDD